MEYAEGDAIAKLGLSHTLKLGRDPTAPLVVLVHGRAGDGKVMGIFKRSIPEHWNILAPQAPLSDPIGGYSWWPFDIREGFVAAADGAASMVFSFIESAIEHYGLAPSILTAIGFSQGGALLSIAIQREPERFNGVGFLASFVVKNRDLDLGARKLPSVFIGHGRKDETVPIQLAEEGRRHLEEKGYAVTFVDDPVGHKIGPSAMRALGSWMRELEKQRVT